MRFWRVLIATKRLGQAHGIDSLLPYRPAENLMVHCPACPKPGVNLEDGWDKTPDFLWFVIFLLNTLLNLNPFFSHLNQTQVTVDGNFHANRYAKNSSPDDYSLFEGCAYFPDDKEYKDYLKQQPKDAPDEVSQSQSLMAHY
jgi:hypothetical protein